MDAATLHGGLPVGYFNYEVDFAVREAIEKLQWRVLQLIVGIDFVSYERATGLVGTIDFSQDGTYLVHAKGKSPILATSEEDCQFVLEFCVNSVLTLQERVGSLDNPFLVSDS